MKRFPGWLIIIVLAVLFCLIWKSAHAANNSPSSIVCRWKKCQAVGFEFSKCSAAFQGSTDDMLRAEREHRGFGKLFYRECVFSADKPALNWEKPTPPIPRGETK